MRGERYKKCNCAPAQPKRIPKRIPWERKFPSAKFMSVHRENGSGVVIGRNRTTCSKPWSWTWFEYSRYQRTENHIIYRFNFRRSKTFYSTNSILQLLKRKFWKIADPLFRISWMTNSFKYKARCSVLTLQCSTGPSKLFKSLQIVEASQSLGEGNKI